MSAETERAFEAALNAHLHDTGMLDPGDLITHYAMAYAVIDTDGDDDVRVLLSGPTEDRAIPAWQAKGLLMGGVDVLERPSSEDDD